ncbi:MAG: AMP-binding protein [Bacteroidota bacterium]
MSSIQPWLNLNGVTYTLDQLKSGSFKTNLSAFEQSTLLFCHRWLNTELEFQLQTSGSTGAPKIITITRQQMEYSASLTINALHLKPGYTALVCLDPKYIAGQMMLVRSLLLGMNMVAVDPVANPFEKISATTSLDFAAFVPYQVQAILNSAFKSRMEGLKCVIIGGAPLDQVTKKSVQSFEGEFYATYGMTETISHIALQRLNGEQRQDFFEVLDDIKICNDERGCLVIEVGFLNPKKIITNDLVEIISKKHFRWLGRWDHIINSGGVKVMPEKVEVSVREIFNSLTLSNRFFIAGLPDEKLSQKVTLVIEGVPFSTELTSEIARRIEDTTQPFERPREMRFINNFRLTENGKVMREETLNLIPVKPQ